jgi:hypothetical protein
MPVGPLGAFGGLTAQDALDIGWYVTTIPPLVHSVPDCQPPTPERMLPRAFRTGAGVTRVTSCPGFHP